MKKFEIQDKSVVLKWIILGFCFLWLLVGGLFYGYRAIISTEWYHTRQLKKAFEEELIHVNEHDQILSVGISPAGQDDAWEYYYDVPETLFDDMTCDNFKEIEALDKVQEILSYDWIMVTFRDATKSMYFISPENEIYWGTSFTVECPSLLSWYKEHMHK